MGQTSSNLQPANGINSANGAGPIGLTGPQGLNGRDGLNGINGATGPMGPAGKDGINGATGPAGLNGKDGINGATGPAGLNGINGKDGKDGINGKDGPIGPQGLQGPKGDPTLVKWKIDELTNGNNESLCFSSNKWPGNSFCINANDYGMNITNNGNYVGYPVFDGLVTLRNFNTYVNKELFASASGVINTNATAGNIADPATPTSQFIIKPAPFTGYYYIIHAVSGLYLTMINPASIYSNLTLSSTATIANGMWRITNTGRIGSYYITGQAGHIINFSYNPMLKGGIFQASQKNGGGYYAETMPVFNEIQIQRDTPTMFVSQF